MREQHMRNGDAFLLVYSVTDRATFENIAYLYSSILRVKNRSQVPMILVANKCDLVNLRKVSKEEGHLLSNFLKIPYIETSAKNGINVDLAFHEAVRIIRYILFLRMFCLKIKKIFFILIEDNLHTT
jgi:small GTP-binding protein